MIIKLGDFEGTNAYSHELLAACASNKQEVAKFAP